MAKEALDVGVDPKVDDAARGTTENVNLAAASDATAPVGSGRAASSGQLSQLDVDPSVPSGVVPGAALQGVSAAGAAAGLLEELILEGDEALEAVLGEALATEAGEPLETAADGAVTGGGGGSEYQDNMGAAIAGLIANGVIDPTALAFGVPELDQDLSALAGDPIAGDPAAGAPFTPSETVIASTLPGDSGTSDGGGGDTGGGGGDTGGGGGGDTGGGGGDNPGGGGGGGGNPGGGGGNPGGGGGGGDAGAGNGGESGDSETGDIDIDPGNSGGNNNAPGTPPGQSNGDSTVYSYTSYDEAGGTIKGFDADTDVIDLSALLSGVDPGDRADMVEIAFGNGKDATINIDSDQNGSFETLLVTLDNYKGDLGMDDIQTDVS